MTFEITVLWLALGAGFVVGVGFLLVWLDERAERRKAR